MQFAFSIDELVMRLDALYQEKGFPGIVVQILVTDGEQPIADCLAALADRHQRCQWHVARDLYFSMHEQGASAADVRSWRDRLWQVMGVELPSEDYDVVPEGVRADVGRRLAAAESDLRLLITEIRKGGFGKAAEYLENASRSMLRISQSVALTFRIVKAPA